MGNHTFSSSLHFWYILTRKTAYAMFFCVRTLCTWGPSQSSAKEPLSKVPLLFGVGSCSGISHSMIAYVFYVQFRIKHKNCCFFFKLIMFSSASVNFYLIIIIDYLHVTAVCDGIHCLARLYAAFHYKLWDALRVRVQQSTNICTAL